MKSELKGSDPFNSLLLIHLWTKADAATAFDDFEVEEEGE
jgi:hypothetical protein